MSVDSSRVHTIDSLRGIAAFAVCFFHLTHLPKDFLSQGLLKSCGSYGWLGVEVFFVISGFIIPYALHRAGYNLNYYGRFVLKRVIRLDPPYLVTILLSVTLGYLAALAPGYKGGPYAVSWEQVLLHLGYLNTFFERPWLEYVFWTLAIEFQYYLSVGLLFPLISHRSPVLRTCLFTALGATAISISNEAYLFHYLFLFMLGMLAYHRHIGLVAGWRFWLSLFLLVVGTFYTLGFLVAAVGLATVCSICFVNINNRALLFLGSISYSLYLVHLPIGTRVVNIGNRFAQGPIMNILVLVVGLMASIVAAWLMYRFIENPAQRWSAAIKLKKAAVTPDSA